MVVRRVLSPAAVLLLLAAAALACGAPPATPSAAPARSPGTPSSAPTAAALPSPVGDPVLGIDWGRADEVERPEEAFALPSPGQSIPFSLGSNRSGHPLHFPGQAMMADVAVLPSGGLASVGYVYPGWHPTAWTSDDGRAWVLRPIADTEFTFPVAMAVGGDGGIVAVGRSGSAPLAWTSADGTTWEPHRVATLGDGSVAERMTAVVAAPGGGFIAGGSVGPELFERHARFWRSADGVDWVPVPDDAAAFAEAEVRAIVRFGDGYVATGVTGSVQDITGSVAWTSPDGMTWTRVDDPALAAGRAVALVNAPFGGLVAVGSDRTEDEALAWVSADGRSWTLAAGEESRQYHGKIRMTDVTAVGDELIAVGNTVGLQRGVASAWVSRDGLHWQKAPTAPIQQQVELYAVVPAGPGVVSVGSFGAPDDYIPTVLLSPAR
ncbi:MAG TPA: hypothetical protein VFO05_16215 [Candidatus Limnocylindrales bacterium]|nr:hypothetical protein [Candidatus Limnocylindrales bacterium]